MSWYDLFSTVYDASTERLYVDARRRAVEALAIEPGHTVLDLPCGTGQSLPGLAAAVGPSGAVVGVDLSAGMLAQAKKRVGRLPQVRLLQASVHEVAVEPVDRVHTFLGMSVFPEWERAFERLWSVLRPGGRFAIVDVYAAAPDLNGKFVNLVARADVRRETWGPLSRVAEGFAKVELDARKEHGGVLFLATGRKPG